MTAKVSACIGIGANLGDARAQVEQALASIAGLAQSRLTAQSSLFRTAPVDAGGDDFINAVARIDTELPAQALLEQLQVLELAARRERPFQNAPRTLDLDLLLYGDQIIATPTLTVPHPRLTQRAFALIPLLQIDPFISIPGHGPAHQFAPAVADQAIEKL